MHRFQRFHTGSRTGRPVCGSSGSRPIGAEPEPVVTAGSDGYRFPDSGTANRTVVVELLGGPSLESLPSAGLREPAVLADALDGAKVHT